MRRLVFSLSVLILLLVSACSQQTPTPTLQATQAPTKAPTVTGQPDAATAPTQVPIVASGPAKCTVKSSLPKMNPTEAALLPPVTEKDWVRGPANAKVTFMDYGDFQ
jgi:hypothetical protein